MAKTIEIEHEGKIYTLEFTRRSVQQLEQTGFNILELKSKPMSLVPELFAGAFIAHHRHLRRDIVDDMFNHMENKEGLLEVLSEMYTDTITTLFDDEESQGKNIAWKVV